MNEPTGNDRLAELDEQLQKVREKRRRAAARLDKASDQVTLCAAEEERLMKQMVELMQRGAMPTKHAAPSTKHQPSETK